MVLNKRNVNGYNAIGLKLYVTLRTKKQRNCTLLYE